MGRTRRGYWKIWQVTVTSRNLPMTKPAPGTLAVPSLAAEDAR